MFVPSSSTNSSFKGVYNRKTVIIVDIDSVPLDIADKIDDIMHMGKEHFKLLAKQFGKSIYDN